MDRYWLLTWTTYGTWLSGDERGFVSNIDDGTGHGVRHNTPRDPYDSDMPGLRRYMQEQLIGPPIYLTAEQAFTLMEQFHETVGKRGWEMLAAAVMANHVHVFVGVPGDPKPEDLLRDIKSYGSRSLNKRWGKPMSETWWTESGSTRKKEGKQAIERTIEYVKNQAFSLEVWVREGERGA